jgi:hypothetical protein
MKKIFLLFTLAIFSLSIAKAQLFLSSETSVFAEYSMFEVESEQDGQFKSENINSYVLGISSTLKLSENIDFIGSAGMSEGFNYNFLTGNLAWKLSPNFNLFAGAGVYIIDDEKWVPMGLDGNEPSDKEFGMNLGLSLQLTESLGLTMRYNIIEEKEDFEVGSMSINGLSFGITLK